MTACRIKEKYGLDSLRRGVRGTEWGKANEKLATVSFIVGFN